MLKHQISYVANEYTRVRRYLNNDGYTNLEDVHIDQPDQLSNFEIQSLLHIKDSKMFLPVILCCLYYEKLDVSIMLDNSDYNTQRFYHSLIDITLNNMNLSIPAIIDQFMDSKANILDKYHCHKIVHCRANPRLLKCFKLFDEMGLYDKNYLDMYQKFVKIYDKIINKIVSVISLIGE